MSEFMKKDRHQELFVAAVFEKTIEMYQVLTSACCTVNHFCFQILTRKMFNVFSRNVLKRVNDASSYEKNTSERKLRKIQCKSSKWMRKDVWFYNHVFLYLFVLFTFLKIAKNPTATCTMCTIYWAYTIPKPAIILQLAFVSASFRYMNKHIKFV